MKKFLMKIAVLSVLGFATAQNASAGNYVAKEVKEKAVKEIAGWEKTLLYQVGDTEKLYEASINDDKGLLKTSATYLVDGNILTGFTYKYYDKNDQEKFEGAFDLTEKYTVVDPESKEKTELPVVDTANGDDAYIQAIYGTTVILRVYAGSWGAYTKDKIFIYKIRKGTPKLVGGPVDIPRTGGANNYTVKIYFASNKVIVGVINKDADGNQTENYVKVFNKSLTSFKKITGTTRSDILADTQKYQAPKFWASEDISYSADYSETYKTIKIYK